MNADFDVVVLGAEFQPAVSMALARRDLSFLFISDRDVIDGWDLPNVCIDRRAISDIAPGEFHHIARKAVLCPSWYAACGDDPKRFALSASFSRLVGLFPGFVLPVFPRPLAGPWIAKGDLRHRPDVPLDGTESSPAEDDYRIGLLYQPRLSAKRNLLTMGYRRNNRQYALGNIEVYQEALAREGFLLAGESVYDQMINERVLEILDCLHYTGYFSMNWVGDASEKLWLTSLRPVPRALFQLFQAGGLDLLEEPEDRMTLPARLRFVVDHHYSEYR